MKKQVVCLGMGLCVALAFSSCKSSQSAYRKAYEKAQQQELANQQQEAAPVEAIPVVTAPTEPVVVESVPVAAPQNDVRHEKVTVVSGAGQIPQPQGLPRFVVAVSCEVNQ